MAGNSIEHRHRRAGRLAAALGLALLTLAGPATGDPAPLRIGVPHVPAAADVPNARLYTQEGFALDLAAEIGRQTGRRVSLIEVGRDGAQEESLSALAAGRLDALVLSLPADEPPPADLDVLPSGYVSGLSVAMRTDTAIRSWEQLAGRTVCVAAPNERAAQLAGRLGAKVSVQPVPAQALMRVRTGECDAALHDEATLKILFGDPEWTKFSATLPAREAARLVLVLPRANGPEIAAVRAALAATAQPNFWTAQIDRWAKDVALEVYLDQDAPDCH